MRWRKQLSELERVRSPRPDALAISRWTRHGSRVSLLDSRYEPVCMYTVYWRGQKVGGTVAFYAAVFW